MAASTSSCPDSTPYLTPLTTIKMAANKLSNKKLHLLEFLAQHHTSNVINQAEVDSVYGERRLRES